MTNKLISAAEVERVVRRRFDVDIATHRKFVADPRCSQEARDRREHWADCLKDTRDDTLAALSALPDATPSPGEEVERLREALQAAEEHITTMLTAVAGGDADAGRRFADKDPVVLRLRSTIAEYRKRVGGE